MSVFRSFIAVLILSSCTQTGVGQVSPHPDISHPSAKKAFALSLVLPGLGHRHAEGGRWSTWGTAFAVADVGLWVSLFTGESKRDHLVQSYQTLARTAAGADISGKDRAYFLALASYPSSEAFREAMLRTRQWDRIDYAERPGYDWAWNTGDNFSRYRSLREDAESLRRRRSVVIASLVANRIISGIVAARKASVSRRSRISVRMGAPLVGGSPLVHVKIGI